MGSNSLDKTMKKLLQSKKGFNINDVPTLGIMLVVIAIVLGVGMTVLTQVLETQHCPSGSYWNATNSMCYTHPTIFENESRTIGFNATYGGAEGLQDLADWQTTWAVIIAAAVVIGIISTYMFFRRQG